MADPADPLEVWSIATFDVVLFGLVGVALGHASGALADVLLGLGTVPGILAFAYLWFLAWIATRWVLADGGLDRSGEDSSSLAVRGAAGGAGVGAGFVAGIVLATGAVNIASSGGSIAVLLYLGFLGVLAGAVVGTVVGTAFALVNVGCYRLTDLVLSRHRTTAAPGEANESPDN